MTNWKAGVGDTIFERPHMLCTWGGMVNKRLDLKMDGWKYLWPKKIKNKKNRWLIGEPCGTHTIKILKSDCNQSKSANKNVITQLVFQWYVLLNNALLIFSLLWIGIKCVFSFFSVCIKKKKRERDEISAHVTEGSFSNQITDVSSHTSHWQLAFWYVYYCQLSSRFHSPIIRN